MVPGPKMRRHRAICGEEALGLAGRLEPLQASLPLPGRLVRVLRAAARIAVLPMLDTKSVHASICGFCQVSHSGDALCHLPLREALRAMPPGGFTIPVSPCTAPLCKGSQGLTP